MRNALLILGGGLLALSLVWCWPHASPPPATPPSAAEPSAPAAAAPAAPAPLQAPAHASSAAELTEHASQQLDADPAAALRDIEQADRLAGAQDPRRRALEIFALVRLGKVGQARALADRFYRAFPRDPQGPQIERLTGYHPRPYGP